MDLAIGVIVPARNEAGNIDNVVGEILGIPNVNEIIIVEGGSRDNTWNKALELENANPLRIKAIQQSGYGKFDGILEAARKSSSNLLLIWDSDGTVSSLDNRRILNLAVDFETCIIGDRFQGIIHPGAMPKLNLIGNTIFSWAWYPIFGMKKVDLFCGSKVFPKSVYLKVPSVMKRIDLFGDLSLISTAMRCGLKVKSTPVEYRARMYGNSNLKRWSTGARFVALTLVSYIYLAKHLHKLIRPHSKS